MNKEINGVKTGSGIVWPDKSRIAVALAFEFEAEVLRISQSALWGKPTTVEEEEKGRYGAYEGIWRCLDMLDTHRIKATFFVPGRVIELYEDTVREIHRRGHEIAYHGYMHEGSRTRTREEENEIMRRSESLIQMVTGRKPVGHRSPHGIMQKDAFELMSERGYLYSSNLRDCDWVYLHKTQNCKPLIEIPTDVNIDDYTFFLYSSNVNPPHRAVYTNEDYIEIQREEFDGMALEGDKVFCMTLHPQFIGRPGRINALSDFAGYMKQSGAWFATCEQITNYVLKFGKTNNNLY